LAFSLRVDRADRHGPLGLLRCMYDRHSGSGTSKRAIPFETGCALAFGTLFSSQGASDTQREGSQGKGSRRPPMVGTTPEGVNHALPGNPRAGEPLSSCQHHTAPAQAGPNGRSTPSAGGRTSVGRPAALGRADPRARSRPLGRRGPHRRGARPPARPDDAPRRSRPRDRWR